MLIDTPLLITGSGPASLIIAKLASGRGLSSLIAGHSSSQDETAVLLSKGAVNILSPHGLFGVLRPYLLSHDPVHISRAAFEQVLKHHCVADMNTTVYDNFSFTPIRNDIEARWSGTISDGTSSWDIRADAWIDAAKISADLQTAISSSDKIVTDLLTKLT
jgi:hypothetical protein